MNRSGAPPGRPPSAAGPGDGRLRSSAQRVWSPSAETGKVRHVELRVTSRTQGEHIILALAGEIDLYTAPRLQTELTAALAASNTAQIVVDMSAVDFCDSTGMNVLLAAHRLAGEKGGDLTLAAPRPPVRKILEVTGLQSVFTIHDDLAAVTGQ